jgi:hypothetical protein
MLDALCYGSGNKEMTLPEDSSVMIHLPHIKCNQLEILRMVPRFVVQIRPYCECNMLVLS